MSLRCSVVIPTYHRLPLLAKCLAALSRQTVPANSFEIIVVDDGNLAVVAEAVRAFEQETGIQAQYVGQTHRRGPAAARNRGWKLARARLIAFTDDDCLPQPNWLEVAMAAFARGATVLTGQLRMPLPNQPTHHDRTTAFLETAEFITANCFCQKAALAYVEGFNEAFDMAWREDSDLQFKLLRAGYSIQPCPEAVVIHPLRRAPWYASLCDERKNRYDALLYKHHPTLFRERIPTYRKLVMRYYATVVCFLVGLAALATAHERVATVAFGVWVLLTGWLVAERCPTGTAVRQVGQTVLTALATPFLSIFWRLYGAVKYQVLYV